MGTPQKVSVNVLFFGYLGERTGKNEMQCEVADLDELRGQLAEEFPVLGAHQYAVAVNGAVQRANVPLKEGDEVAFLPPFAGG